MIRYEWEPYLQYSHKRVLKKGDILYSQGEQNCGFYYLSKGKLLLEILSEDGKERIIDYIIDGYLLGEQGINGQPYSTTAVCDTDAVVYFFSQELFINICKQHPEANQIFMNSLIKNVRLLVDTINIINKPYEQQMAHYFIQLFQKNDHGPFSITQNTLSKYIGASRVTVYKIMQKWVKEKLISRQRNEIHILDLKRLEMLLIDNQEELLLKSLGS